ncbi:cubilin-like [Clavelina lepadiformis]|uniref:cubilin-like n=1 Tax=Clavelina lepadiformis TaxID=159417 RepID=UPI0040412698
MRIRRLIVLLFALHFIDSTVNACRFQQKVKVYRRDVSYRTREMRPYFIKCLAKEARNTYKSWKSIVDFVVLETRWFAETEDVTCAKAANLNNKKCWRSAVRKMLRPNSALIPHLLHCMKHRKFNATTEKGKKHDDESHDQTCLSEISGKYEDCFTKSLNENGNIFKTFHLESVLGFLQSHWACEIRPVTDNCFPKSNATCHTQSWLRRMATLTKPTSPFKTILNKCNAEVFPRSVRENCKKLHPTLGTEYNVMTSPGYPHRKKHNFDCLYQFKSQNSFGLELKVEVDTESCCDFVTVFLKNLTTLAKLSGNVTKTFEVDHYDREIFVRYHTDGSVASKGFRISHRNACKYDLPYYGYFMKIHPPTFFHLGNIFLQKFGQEMECTWTITRHLPQGWPVRLLLERIRMSDCCDQLEVFSGPRLLGNYKIAKASNIPIMANGSFTIRYYTNFTKSRNGFRASFGWINHLCYDEFKATDEWTNFSFDGQNGGGAGRILCYWYITSSPGYAVALNISAYSNSTAYGLAYESLEIFDGPKLVRKFINERNAFVSSENRFAINQLSYGAKSFAFNSYFRQVPCNVTYNLTGSASMKLASPDYEGFPFNIYQRCTYTLHAQPGKNIRMTLQTFTKTGFVEVLSGDVNFGRASGVNKTFRLTSSGNTIQLHYTAPKAFSARSRGFFATYRQVRSNCGALLVANTKTQLISSPDYSHNNSSNNVFCDWIITASPDNKISFSIHNLALDQKGALTVYDKMTSMGRFTELKTNTTISSSSNVMRIRLRHQGASQRGLLGSFKELKN